MENELEGTLKVLCHSLKTTLALLLVGVSDLKMATTKVDKYGKPYKIADKVFLEKQKDLLRLFKFILQTNFYEDQAKIAKTYRIEDHVDSYTSKTVVKEFVQLWKEGFLPRGACFSPYYKAHLKQATVLFDLFYHAKDWDVFYKTACWAREYVNEIMFCYAMNIAIHHRSDTQGLLLPPLYELYPYFFVNSEVIDKAYEYKMKYSGVQKSSEIKTYTIPADYSGWCVNTNPEQKELAYFTEDVGLNSYYGHFHCSYPFWLGGEEIGLKKDRRGELFYWEHHQILAKYYMERLSNNLGSIPVFEWKDELKTGYVPYLRHHTGMELPTRPAHCELKHNPHNQPWTVPGEDHIFEVQNIEDYERRIRDAVDSGFVMGEDGTMINIYEVEGFDMLGKVIESNPDSPNTRFYGPLMVLAHHVLGYSGKHIEEYKIVPSAMECVVTDLRDPVFYQFYKKMIHYFLKYKNHLPSYTYNELAYPGFKVEGVTVDKLVTYFDHFDFEITNGLYFTQEEFEKDNFHVLARQYRLNHKPFNYKIQVQSDKKTDVVVRVYLGPKHDEHGHQIPLDENRINFVELDKFVHTVQSGKNVIERNCYQTDMAKDRTSYRKFYHHVLSALKGEEEYHLDMNEAPNCFPTRLMLPKGKVEGQEFQLFFYVTPYKPITTKYTYDKVYSAGFGSGLRYLDTLPFGYPFDRPIEDEKVFFVPNCFMKDVVIYHKPEEETTTPHMMM